MPAHSKGSGRTTWKHKLAAVCFGVGLFAALEGLLAWLGLGKPEVAGDPFVGFSAVHPLYVRNPATGLMETSQPRRRHFVEEEFSVPKPAGTFRVFCFGGSTVQGNPWSKETAFSTWLKLSLESADPDRTWEVINCGGISYASYRLVNIVEECLKYQPDLYIICTGHNEFLEDRTYSDIKHAPPLLTGSIRVASRLRSFNLLRSAWERSVQDDNASRKAAVTARATMPEEIDPWLDYDGGIKAYHRDPEWKAGVVRHYEHNLRRMVAMAEQAGVPVILVKPSSNLRDCPPFKSQHRDGMSAAELQEWETLVSQAHQAGDKDPERRMKLLQEALSLDDAYAMTHYQLARCLDAQGHPELAREFYLQAREEDICPLRMIASLEEAMTRVAREAGALLIDAHTLFESRSRDGILGDDWLVDHIHPGIDGYKLMGAALMDLMVALGWVKPAFDWEQRRDASFKQHLEALPESYFEDGQTHLRGLRAWTEGRALGPSVEYKLMQSKPGQK